MTSALIDGRSREEVFAPTFWRFGDLHAAVEAVVRGSWLRRQPPEIRGTGYCVDALEAALWAVGGAADFREAVLRAANLGDDADTTAAIAGQLAGARWGASGIPPEWCERVVSADRIIALAGGLYEAGGGRGVDRSWHHDRFIHAWWVEPGQILAGEYPGHPENRRAAEKVNLLLDVGIRSFIDLTTPADGLIPYADLVESASAARRLDVRRHPFPIPDLGVTSDDTCDELVRVIREEQQRGGVSGHCWGGVGRSCTVVGSLPADTGLRFGEIVSRLRDMRHGTRKAGRACPATDAQREFLQHRASRGSDD